MKNIVISGYYGFGNSGDEAILDTIISDITESDPKTEITVLSIKPALTMQQHGIKAIHRYNIFKVINTIKKCDLFISGGGSLIQDITSTRSLLYYLTIIRFAAMFGKKIMIYANGIGPVNIEKNRIRSRKILNKVDVITLREADSYKLIREMGINKPVIHITADPVLTYRFSDEKRVKEIFELEEVPLSSDLLGINLREWKESGNLEDEIVKSIEYLNKRYNLTPVFIPMSESDKDISLRVMKNLKCKSYMLVRNYDPKDLIGIIGHMKLVIAMRLHTLIYASINSVPMLGLVYDPKIKGYMEYIRQAYTGEVKGVTYYDINSKIDNIIENYEAERVQLNDIVSELKLQSKRNAEIAVNLLNEKGKA